MDESLERGVPTQGFLIDFAQIYKVDRGACVDVKYVIIFKKYWFLKIFVSYEYIRNLKINFDFYYDLRRAWSACLELINDFRWSLSSEEKKHRFDPREIEFYEVFAK